MGNEKSTLKDLTFSVPQSSVLGHYCLHSWALLSRNSAWIVVTQAEFLYADDTQFYVFFAPVGDDQLDSVDHLCSCLLDIGEWSRINLLMQSDHKTGVMVFETKQKLLMLKDIRIIIGDSTMIPSSSVRNLGFVFD